MQMWLIIVLSFGLTIADQVGPPGFAPTLSTNKPFGPYYCQARCLASCVESYLATTVEECKRYCPPMGEYHLMQCAPDDAACWQKCGVPPTPYDMPAPESPRLTPLIIGNDDNPESDPFVIRLAWDSVPNASLYIVEFYPRNRVAKPGESNFFQVVTTSLAYSVRKEDECVEYSARVIAVNSFGISVPTYAFIGAPSPIVNNNELFSIRSIRRDAWSTDMITVTIDYKLPSGWPIDDIDIDSIKVSAKDCMGPLGVSFGEVPETKDNLELSYDAIIGKTPVTAIQIMLTKDVLESNCLFEMKLTKLVTRCNTSVSFEEDIKTAPGISFRLNCNTIEGGCENSTEPTKVIAPVPLSSNLDIDPTVVVPSLNSPAHMPIGIDRPEETVSIENSTAASDNDEMPTPPELPLFLIGQNEQAPNVPVQPMPPGSSISVVDFSPNGTMETIAIIPQSMLPPLCDLDMLDVDPTISSTSNSVVDMRVIWLERQPLPPPPPASYFTIRYGPIIRKLVDDSRQPSEIVPGYETIVRTGQKLVDGMVPLPDPTREISITGLQRGTLLKIQICAIFDPNSEPLIQWDTVPSTRIDLAALEPFLELDKKPFEPQPPIVGPLDMQVAPEVGAIVPMQPPVDLPPPPVPEQEQAVDSSDDNIVNVPLILQLDVDPKPTPVQFWLTTVGCVLLVILTAMLLVLFLRRLCNSGRMVKKIHMQEKPMFIVNTIPAPPPVINETVKVPLP